jgi:hypothetical protein
MSAIESNEANKAVVQKMWRALGEMDWETLKSCMHPDIHYQDVKWGQSNFMVSIVLVHSLR